MSEKHYIIRKHGDGERPGVMWAWLDRLEADVIVHQIEKFKEAGIEEFYIHPAWMLEVDDYLSDYFMEMIRVAADTAERLGMKYSLYDDYDWASGMCAGKVTENNPELRMVNLRGYRLDAQAGEPVEIWFKGEVLAVQVQYGDKLGGREDITDQVKIELFAEGVGGRVLWDNTNTCACAVWVFCKFYLEGICATSKWASFTKNTRGFIDVMNPASTQKFIEIGHETYKRTLGDYFGKSITRLFTDETSYASLFDLSPTTVPYSTVIEDAFEKEHGYPIRQHFISLVNRSEADEDVKVRYHYFKTCTRLFCEGYIEQVADWCHQNGIELTGHMSGEGILKFHTMQMGDFYETLSRFDVPGVDNIGSKFNVDNGCFGWETKMLSSVAKFAGKKRTMCETFSGSGWDLSLEDAKRIMNRLMSLGVTYSIYMTAFYSLNEGRKNFPIGYPPSHGFNNPLFRHYNELTDYNAVRSSLVCQTTPRGRVLVFIPQVNSWVHPFTDGGKLQEDWSGCTIALQKRNVEHDIFFEPLSKEVKVKDGKVEVKGFVYDTVVVPYLKDTTQDTIDWLVEFAKQGGRLVFVDALDSRAVDTSNKYDFAEICGISEEGKKMLEENGCYASRIEGNVQIINTGRKELFPTEQFRDDISAFVRGGSDAEPIEDVEVPAEVFLSRRDAEGIYCCMVCNDTNETKTVKLKINGSGELLLLDGIALESCTAEDGIVTLEVTPHDMPILILKAPDAVVEMPDPTKKIAVAKGASRELAFDNEWHISTVEKNMLPLKIRYLTKAEPAKTLSPELAAMAETANEKYACHEFPACKGLTYGSGYAAYARFEIKDMPESLELFNEVVDDGELWLNGKLLTDFTKVIEWGPRDSVTDITDYVKLGTNTLVLISRMPNWKGPHQMPWAVVRGNFRLDKSDAITVTDDIAEPTVYTTQGWRYFGGNINYKGSFDLTENDGGRINVSLDTNEVVEVVVNGVSGGTLYWKPYAMDITELCKVGKNHIELRYTTSYDATMKLEEVVLIRQGVMEYRDEAPIKYIGMLSAPKLTVTM